MTAPVIIDTNVVVAGMLSARAHAPTARILDGMLATHDDLVLVTGDARLLESKDWPQRNPGPRQWLDGAR